MKWLHTFIRFVIASANTIFFSSSFFHYYFVDPVLEWLQTQMHIDLFYQQCVIAPVEQWTSSQWMKKRKHFKITASIKCQRQCSDGENQRQYRWRRCRRQQRKWKICSPISNIFFNLHIRICAIFMETYFVALCLPCFCENVQFI